MAEIYIDCERYRNAARLLRELSGETEAARTRLISAAGFVGDAWQGASAGAFLETNEWTAKDLERLRVETEDLASDIDAAAAAFEETEHRLKGAL
ncbi:MAG: WXG100 family type VII secretion target [Clostridiales Family XIII bacterium]|jgi:uncharacterized protein YukE|nr:WXG100 family type VII secretion target [Clostridiales Family XIII bacterium]